MNLTVNMLELIWARALQVAPRVLLVLVVLIGGLIVSAILRRLGRWLVRKSGLEALAESVGIAKLLYAVGIKKGLAELVGSLAWLAGVLLTIAAVADLLDLEAVSTITALAIRFLPRLFAASAVLLAGIALASVVRRLVSRFGRRSDDLERPDFVAKLAQYVILTVTVALAADQAGLETDIVYALILVVVGVGLASVGLSFALGARPVFGKLAARHYFAGHAEPGDRVKVGDHEGVVVRYSAVAMVLDLGDGRQLVVPCDQLLAEPVVVEPLTGVSSSRPASPDDSDEESEPSE